MSGFEKDKVVDEAIRLMRMGINLRVAAENAGVGNATLKSWLVNHCTEVLNQAGIDLSTRHTTLHPQRTGGRR